MEIRENRELEEKVLRSILEERRRGFHVTDLIGCLRKAWFSMKGVAEEVNERVKLLTVSGKALHGLLESFAVLREIEREKDGVIGRIDAVGDRIVELKTTRSTKAEIKERWVKQLMAYCYMAGEREADLLVFYINRGELRAWRLSFTEEELRENWEYIVKRKERLKEALEKNLFPFDLREKWECEACGYKKYCKAMELYVRCLG